MRSVCDCDREWTEHTIQLVRGRWTWICPDGMPAPVSTPVPSRPAARGRR